MNKPGALPNPALHRCWDPVNIAKEEVRFMHVARRRGLVAGGAMLLSLAVGIYSAIEYIQATVNPPKMAAVTPSGWVFAAQPKPLKITEEQLFSGWRQIVEAHFARTENGSFKDLAPYSTEKTLEDVEKILKRGSSEKSYFVSLVLVEHRLVAKTSSKAELNVRGRLTVVDSHQTATSEVFLSSFFIRGSAEGPNLTGWRLAGIHDIDSAKFFSAEREKVREGVFGKESSAPSGRQ